jgi:hypothetical protein
MTDDCERDLREKIAVLNERLVGMETARRLQADEYARRLDELNHAHDQAIARNAHYVTREMWEARNVESNNWRRGVDREMSELRGNRAGLFSAMSMLIALIAVGLTVLQWLS